MEYLAGALRKAGHIGRFASRYRLDLIDAKGQPRLALFSAITSEYPMVRRDAAAAREEGLVTAVGGYHASGFPEDTAKGPFDYVIVGEGEEVVVALAEAVLYERPSCLAKYNPKKQGNVTILSAPRIRNLAECAPPSRAAERLGTYVLYDLMCPPTSRQRNLAIVLTSRGCRHACDFCASATVWGHGMTRRTKEDVVAELRDLKTRFGTNTVVIIDQSFGQDKEWTLDLCRAIKDADLGLSWYHQSNLDIDREVIVAMAEAGCTKIGFGLEGLSPSAVQRIKPPNPTSFDEINRVFDFCTELGLFVKAYTIIGFPWETEETIAEYMHWLPSLRASQVKISYMTPFPGTAYWRKYKDQLLTTDWEDFDTVRMPVVRNPHITVPRYHAIRNELFRAFHGSDQYTEGVRRMIEKFPQRVESYREFAGFLDQFGLITGTEPWLADVSYESKPGLALAQTR